MIRSLLAISAVITLSASLVEAQLTEPNFSLEDINPSSERVGQQVSPRSYRQQITGWYFGYEW